jgi:hypothetical protein
MTRMRVKVSCDRPLENETYCMSLQRSLLYNITYYYINRSRVASHVGMPLNWLRVLHISRNLMKYEEI